MVWRWLSSTRSSIRAPLRLIEPDSDGVSIRTRGLDASAAETLCTCFGDAGPAGCAPGCGRGCCLPASTFAVGGLAAGKYLFAAKVQPMSTIALSTTARIKFLLSFTCENSSRYRVVALSAPRVAAADALEGHPAPARGSIAFDCGDR